MLERWQACALCHSQKRRCDGARPKCGSCVKSGHLCRYEGKKKPRLPQSHAELSARLGDLRMTLQKMLANRASVQRAERGTPTAPASHSILADYSQPNERTQPHADPQVQMDISDNDRDYILDIFFRYQPCIITQIDRFYFYKALLSEDPTMRPHPTLVDAMILVGLLFAELLCKNYKPPRAGPDPDKLLSRIHHGLAASLEMADRLLDYMQASVLVGFWYFCRGRFQEETYLSSSLFRLAINCKLHQIDGDVVQETLNDRSSPSFWDGTILGRPRDRYELHQRIAIFWQCHCSEQGGTLVAGLPSACDEWTTQSITTVWPTSLGEFESGFTTEPLPNRSIRHLLAGDVGDSLCPKPVFQTVVLLSRASQLSAVCSTINQYDQTRCEELIQTVRTLATATQHFASIAQMGILHDSSHHPEIHADPPIPILSTEMRIGDCATRIELLRAAEQLTNVKSIAFGLGPHQKADIYEILAPLALPEGGSFSDIKFAVAKAGISQVHNTLITQARREENSKDPASTTIAAKIPNGVGFFMGCPMFVIIDYIRQLKTQQGHELVVGNPLLIQGLSIQLQDAEDTLAQGLEVMTLLSINVPILKFQLEKIEEAYAKPL